MISADQLNPITRASAQIARGAGGVERCDVHGTYHFAAVRARSLEQYEDLIAKIRTAEEFARSRPGDPKAYAWARGKVDQMQRQIAKISDPLWEDDAPNVVTTLGRNYLLDNGMAGSAYTAAFYVGLISSVGFTNLATTVSALASYTSGTGIASITTAAAHGLLPGDTVTIGTVTGTGTNIASVQGTWIAQTGTTGSTLNIFVGYGLTITTLTGGAVTTTSGTRIGDTAASHANWTEAGVSSNFPLFSQTNRVTAAWSAASADVKSLASAAVFNIITTGGTVEGAFLSTLATLGATTGTLFSAGMFTGGAKVVAPGDTLNVSYSLSI